MGDGFSQGDVLRRATGAAARAWTCIKSNAGSARTPTHIHQSKMVLKELGIDQGRLRQEWICTPEMDHIPDLIAEFCEDLRALGPLRPSLHGTAQENA